MPLFIPSKIDLDKTISLRWGLFSLFIGGCLVDPTYTGPKLPFENGKYLITEEFIKEMVQWFKDGKTIAKRYAWEIVLGAHDQFIKEETLVDVVIPPGATCDVIGDVHGESIFCLEGGEGEKKKR